MQTSGMGVWPCAAGAVWGAVSMAVPGCQSRSYSFLLMNTWQAAGDSQGLGSLPPPWETWMEFQPPGFDLAQPWLLRALGEEVSEQEHTLLIILSLTPSLCLSIK